MNLRILKKLSKRAAPLLALLDDRREQFRAEPHDNYTSTGGHDRKHWERGRSVHGDKFRERDIKYRPRRGDGWIRLSEPCHPLAGTVMVGAMSVGEEPEWSEETAWDSLRDIVYWGFAAPNAEGDWRCTRRRGNPSRVFALAGELVDQKRNSAAPGVMPGSPAAAVVTAQIIAELT